MTEPDFQSYPQFFHGKPIQYSAYSYMKVYTRSTRMEEDEINLCTVAGIALFCLVMMTAILVKNCCWHLLPSRYRGKNTNQFDPNSETHLWNMEKLKEMTYLDDSRYLSCQASKTEEKVILRELRKTWRPLATNDVIVNTSGVQRIRILRRHNTEPVIKETAASSNYFQFPFNKLGSKKRGKRAKSKKRENPDRTKSETEEEKQMAKKDRINSELIEPPIWLLAEEDLEASAASGSQIGVNFPVSNRSSQPPSPSPNSLNPQFSLC